MEKDKNLSKKFAGILKKEGILALAKKMAKEFSGAEMYLVGGAVRDIIIGRTTKDIDVLVRKVKINDLEKFLGKCGRVDLVGKRFSVLKFTPLEVVPPSGTRLLTGFTPKNPPLIPLLKRGRKGDLAFAQGEENVRQIDIALPRTDFAYGTGGYKDFKVKANPNLPIEDDLARRDFTVNAMAWDIYNSRLVDPYGGLADLKKKIIRAVGEPKERFAEDYSRMLRAIRFSMQLGFKIETKTWAAVKKMMRHINDIVKNGDPTSLSDDQELRGASRKVPYEVVASEFLKSFDAEPVETIKKYFEIHAIEALMPELLAMKKCSQPKEFHSEGDVMIHTLMALDNIETKFFKKYFSETVDLDTKVAILLHDIGKPATKTKKDGRTVFYNHDKIGAELAGKFLERLKLSAPPEARVDVKKVLWLISNHMLFMYSDPRILKKTTIEKYLFHKVYGGLPHMQLFLLDALACRPAKVKLDLSRFKAAYKVWKEMGKSPKATLPAPFLNGDEIMKILKIAPGQKVGEIIIALREEQLNGRVKNKKDAEKFIKKIKI